VQAQFTRHVRPVQLGMARGTTLEEVFLPLNSRGGDLFENTGTGIQLREQQPGRVLVFVQPLPGITIRADLG
jgi:hypothetical protein